MRSRSVDPGSDLDRIDFFDPGVVDCPYPAYRRLRDSAPVWQDPATGMFVITRYDDVRAILLDTERFSSDVGKGGNRRERAFATNAPEGVPSDLAARAALLQDIYDAHGLEPAANLSTRDEPTHMQVRRLFDEAFRPEAIRELVPYVRALASELLDDFIDDGRCEWVSQFAAPLPLRVIGRMVGVATEDLPRIKEWSDAWVSRMGLMQPEAEVRRSVELEIEARQYFQKRYEELRSAPDGTLLSALVNRVIPEWGRPLNDSELHAEVMSDLLVGGSETTTSALGAGIVLLARNPPVWEQLKAAPAMFLEPFVEELLRLESPVQGLLRQALVDVELHGVTVPAAAVVNLRYAAANRDERRFARPEEIDLARRKPRQHLAFGVGSHHCLGAPLARCELYYAFEVIVDRIEECWLGEVSGAIPYQKNFFLRAPQEVHICFRRG